MSNKKKHSDKQRPGPPDGEQNLLTFLEFGPGRLDDATIASVETWLAGNGTSSTPPPELIVARARRAIKQEPVLVPSSPLPRLLASLVYDTRTQELPMGVRAVIQRAHRLFFTADEFEILVQVSPEAVPERLRVFGQVLLAGEPVAAAVIRLDGPPGRIDGATDDAGEFKLLHASPGDYTMEVATPGNVIEIPMLNLESAT